MSFLKKLAKFVIGITLIIVAHEMGHAIAARLCGVKVERFSIGFGPGYEIHNVPVVNELVLSPILLGGYVELDQDVLAAQSIPEKLFIFTAGMLANALFGFTILTTLNKKLLASFLFSFGNWLLFPLTLLWLLIRSALPKRKQKNPKTPLQNPIQDSEISFQGPVQIIKRLTSSKTSYFLALAELNVGVAAGNLLPIFPLDGGAIAEIILVNIFEGQILNIVLLTFRMCGVLALGLLLLWLILGECFKSGKTAKINSKKSG